MADEPEGPNSIYGRATAFPDGPLKGWLTWSMGQDPYETYVGPFGFRPEPDGAGLSAFAPQPHHLNGSGAIHGGALMSFADFALFSIAHNSLKGGVQTVTLTLNAEFVGAGDAASLIHARGDVVRETGGLVFARGLVTQADRTLLAFSGTLRKLRPRGGAA
ncbi:MAG: PaaI family thioesterase [Alphaproteobacteria bacterium]|nr:PaaI family thioesterase [Alphaproteobacteria bacterium]